MSKDLTEAEIIARLEIALSQMPMLRREIFLAIRLDDASYQELAARTGLSAEAIERHFAAALYQLDHHLSHGRPPGRRGRWRVRLRLR